MKSQKEMGPLLWILSVIISARHMFVFLRNCCNFMPARNPELQSSADARFVAFSPHFEKIFSLFYAVMRAIVRIPVKGMAFATSAIKNRER
jgi:hypothetical protein